MLRKLDLPSKHKGVVTAFSQRWTVGCIEVTSSLEMKISPTSADNVMPTLKTDFVPTLWCWDVTIIDESHNTVVNKDYTFNC